MKDLSRVYILLLTCALLVFNACSETEHSKFPGSGGAYNDKYNLNLRDTGPAGGLIFYINSNDDADKDGWKYLEAAPIGAEEVNKQWSSNTGSVGVTDTAIGYGKSHTAKIVAWLGDKSETDRAAQLCDDLVFRGFNDWFLPSSSELYEMFLVLKSAGVGDFSGTYWSSTEFTNATAFRRDFDNTIVANLNKNTSHKVRPVRRF
jgi:hypothetical protein